tara:strand:- start:683 stop:859 length:177 start_codon:yes stop_codon:yes gene_type:complete
MNKKITQKQFEQLLELVDLMGWDYDRFSSSGQETYDKICKLLGWEKLTFLDEKEEQTR